MKKCLFSLAAAIITALCVASSATRLSDFADSIPAGRWVPFQTDLTQDMVRSGTGEIFNYAQNAVWDSISDQLLFLGQAHGRETNPQNFIIYDAASDHWREEPTPRGTRAEYYQPNRMGHVYDHQTIIPDKGEYYVITYNPDTSASKHFFYRYRIAAGQWDTLDTPLPSTPASGCTGGGTGCYFDVNYIYAGAMEYFPELSGLVMLSGYVGNRGTFLDVTQPEAQWEWANFGAAGGGYYHSILAYNPVHKVMMSMSVEGGISLIDTNSARLPRRTPVFVRELQDTKLVPEPVTGNFLAVELAEYKRFWTYDLGGDQWHELPQAPDTAFGHLTGLTCVGFAIPEYRIIGLLSYNSPRMMVYKYAEWADTLPVAALHVYAADTAVEVWGDSSYLTVTADRQGGGTDTVTTSCFFYSLDTTVAVVKPGGVIVPAYKSPGGPVDVEAVKSTALGVWRDTITLNVVPSTAVLDSIRLDRDSLVLLTGDRFPLVLKAHYHRGTVSFWTFVDTTDVLVSTDPAVVAAYKTQIRGESAGECRVAAVFGGQTDTMAVRVIRSPSVVRRINFMGPGSYKTHVFGWLEDIGNSDAYSALRGYGYTDGNAGGWGTNEGFGKTNEGQLNALLRDWVYPYDRVGNYRIDVPDGRYIVKTAMGTDGYYQSSNYWITFGGDTIIHVTDGDVTRAVDTITVTGGAGAQFQVYGAACFILLVSDDVTDFEAVTWDTLPNVIIEDSVWNAFMADTAWDNSVSSGTALAPECGISLSASPNPFNPSVRIRYRLGRWTGGTLAFFNARGVLLRTAGLKGNEGAIVWNGRDRAGRALPSGIYFCRMTVKEGKSRCMKLFLLK